MAKLPDKTLERKLFRNGYREVVAVDEVGMGCLAGPVVVCAVAFTPKFYRKAHPKLFRLRDSKLLLPPQRERFARMLKFEKGLRHSIGLCYPKTIDRMNIYQASRLAMRRAVRRLIYDSRFMIHESKIVNRESRIAVLIDGPHNIAGLQMKQIPIVKGDRKVFGIACASILAKTYRDRMMVRYAKKYPEYGFEVHKGYGTKMHRMCLAANGPSPLHRMSFCSGKGSGH